jgi:Acyl-protein synthetase, LuxE
VTVADSIALLLAAAPFGVAQADKDAALAPVLDALTAHHRAACPPYARVIDVLHGDPRGAPWIPVGLFKSHALQSVPDDQISTVLTSSGTTGQVPSRIALDAATAQRQSLALSKIMAEVLGPRRLPMLIVDQQDLLKNRSAFSARGAGVLGMMNFGRQPVFVLGPDLALDVAAVEAFLARHGGAPFLIFGFTFMIWRYLLEPLRGRGLDLSRGVMIHSGGWKKLADQAVDNATFKAALHAETGLARVHNFYGMVEQVGSVFLEGDDGYLHAPRFADVIIRDPRTLAPVGPGEVGVIQVVSALPTSYPGHSLLTEDLGVVHAIDDGAWRGRAFSVLGRLPRAELRGCSDTHAAEVRA